jgi:hypothetical protein
MLENYKLTNPFDFQPYDNNLPRPGLSSPESLDQGVCACPKFGRSEASAASRHFVEADISAEVLASPIRMNPMQNGLLLNHGYGLTTVVARPTAGADEVSISELSAAGALLYRKIQTNRPRFLAFLGKKAYSAISGRATVEWGVRICCSATPSHGFYRIQVAATAVSRSTNSSWPTANSGWLRDVPIHNSHYKDVIVPAIANRKGRP